MRPRVLVLVLAGGAGGRLELLTEQRAKPAVPYAGTYSLIDVPLSNCLHSGIADVWVIEQFNPASLAVHLSNGRPWDLDRSSGGLMVLHPHLGAGKAGWHTGTADALWRQAGLIRDHGPDALVVVSSDAVYRLDYRDVVDAHLNSGAAVTMVTTRVQPEDAGRYGVVQVDDGTVVDYVYKPDEPASDLIANEVFVLEPGRVLDLLDELADALPEDDEDGLGDLGEELLPRLVADGVVREHRFDDYWRDLGTIDAYWQAHQDLLQDEPPFVPDESDWPLVSAWHHRGPARGARRRSGRRQPAVGGTTVERSVRSPGVVVEAGATVRDSVLPQRRRGAVGRDRGARGPGRRRRGREGRVRRRRRRRRAGGTARTDRRRRRSPGRRAGARAGGRVTECGDWVRQRATGVRRG